MINSLKLSWLVTVRHWKVYRKYIWSNILPTIIEPCFFIVSLGVGMAAFVGDINGMSYATFMAPGLAMSAAMFTAFFESSYGFYVRMAMDGIYKAMFTTPLGPKEVIFGELIWVSLKGAVMAIVVSSIFTIFGFLSVTPNIFGMMAVGFFVGTACGSMGLISAALIKNISQFQTVYALVISPLFFFSGNLFPIDNMPIYFKAVAHLSPLYHGVVLGQQLLWQKVDLLIFLQHFVELLALCALLAGVAYKMVYKKLYK